MNFIFRKPDVFDSVFQVICDLKCFSADDLMYLKCSLDSARTKAGDGTSEIFCSTGEIKVCMHSSFPSVRFSRSISFRIREFFIVEGSIENCERHC